VDIAGTTYYISKEDMSWWDAVSACEALGNKKLLAVEDIVVRNDSDTTGSLSNSDNGNIKTAVGVSLYEKGWGSSGTVYIWTTTMESSCYPYYVSMPSGYTGDDGPSRNDGLSMSAVCK
jgi:hypothetical protein